MKFNSYTIVARLIPGIIAGLPLFVLHFYFLQPILGAFWGELLGSTIVSGITIPLIFLFSFMQLGRFVSKELFEKKLFNNGLNMPSGDLLLHLNKYFSHEYKVKIHKRIKADFGFTIPSLAEEKANPIHSRKIISEAVSRIRAKVSKGKLVGQHNAEYGFWRNVSGGSIIALAATIADIILFKFIHYDHTALWISIVLLCLYLIHLVFAKRMIITAGHDYAKVLIQEYMSIV